MAGKVWPAGPEEERLRTALGYVLTLDCEAGVAAPLAVTQVQVLPVLSSLLNTVSLALVTHRPQLTVRVRDGPAGIVMDNILQSLSQVEVILFGNNSLKWPAIIATYGRP